MENIQLINEVKSYSNLITIKPNAVEDDEYLHHLGFDEIDALVYDLLISMIETIDRLDKYINSDITIADRYNITNWTRWLKIQFNNTVYFYKPDGIQMYFNT